MPALQSCEKIRISLEQLEPDRDMENFVRDYGTGNIIPEPPKFINYTDAAAANTGTAQQPPRYAHFPRSSSRQMAMGEVLRNLPQEEEPDGPGLAGYGAGGGQSPDKASALDRANTLSNRPMSSHGPVNGVNGTLGSLTQPSSAQSQTSAPTVSSPATSVPPSSVRDTGEKTMLQIGDGVYEVDPTHDPQSAPNSSGGSVAGAAMQSRIGAGDDPLPRQMQALRNAAISTPNRRNSFNASAAASGYQGPLSASGVGHGPSSVTGPGPQLSAPSPSKMTNMNYRNSAELVVGGPPPSRPTSPGGPPVAAHMIPPQQKPSSPLPIESTLSNYAQALPGERRASMSRSTSPAYIPSHSHNQSLGQNIARGNSIDRPLSREGFAGIGANGRSPSPGPGAPSNATYAPPTSQPSRVNPIGISLDESGQVTQDDLAEQYRRQNAPPPVQQPAYGGPAPPTRSAYGTPAPTAAGYSQPQYQPQPPQPPNWPQGYAQPPQEPQYVPPPPGHHPYAAPPPATPVQPGPSGYSNQYNHTGYADPSPVRRSPSPAAAMNGPPTGQWIDGMPVKFYGTISLLHCFQLLTRFSHDQSKHYTTIRPQLKKSLTSRQETSSRSHRRPRTAGGLASSWMTHDVFPAELSSPVTLSACSNSPASAAPNHFTGVGLDSLG